jgi:hypothetical protein
VNVLKITDLGAKLDGVATYHDSCAALREYGVKNEPRVLECEKNNNLRQQFFENMIENKSILNKKIRKKKINNDILKNNVFYTTCRYFFTVTIINYNLLSEITKNYFVLLRKDKK